METTEKPPTSAELLETLQPKRLELAALKMQLENERKRLGELEAEYNDECLKVAAGRGGTPVETQERMRPILAKIEGLTQWLGQKKATLEPLEAEYRKVFRAEKVVEEDRSIASFIEEIFAEGDKCIDAEVHARKDFEMLFAELRRMLAGPLLNEGNKSKLSNTGTELRKRRAAALDNFR